MKKNITKLLVFLLFLSTFPQISYTKENKENSKGNLEFFGWSTEFLCNNSLGLEPEDKDKCTEFEKKNENGEFLAEPYVPPEDGVDPNMTLIPPYCSCADKFCMELSERDKLEKLFNDMGDLYNSCTLKFQSCKLGNDECFTTLKLLKDKNQATQKLLTQREAQLDDANKRISKLEDGDWYDYIFYYIMPAVVVGMGIYIGVDIASDTEHPF